MADTDANVSGTEETGEDEAESDESKTDTDTSETGESKVDESTEENPDETVTGTEETSSEQDTPEEPISGDTSMRFTAVEENVTAKDVLTADEIRAPYHFYSVDPQSEGLVAYWKFDNGAGCLITDYANGYDLICNKDPKWVNVTLPAKN